MASFCDAAASYCFVRSARSVAAATLTSLCRAFPTCSIDSFAPAESPFGLAVYLGAAPRLDSLTTFAADLAVVLEQGTTKSKTPDEINSPGVLFWRRPTLARPFVALPSGLQRFTSVFGMGTGGATAR
jgi:hypothetical protein